jgi:hypothetical protein
MAPNDNRPNNTGSVASNTAVVAMPKPSSIETTAIIVNENRADATPSTADMDTHVLRRYFMLDLSRPIFTGCRCFSNLSGIQPKIDVAKDAMFWAMDTY